MPGDCEGVLLRVGGRVEGLVERDGSVKFFLADVALCERSNELCQSRDR